MPMPVLDYKPAADVKVDPNHGLWQFFYGKDKLLLTPEEDAEHGRAWTVEELRHKDWEDLHRLWWVCCKEQNRIATHRREKQNMRLKNGIEETADRMAEVGFFPHSCLFTFCFFLLIHMRYYHCQTDLAFPQGNKTNGYLDA